MAQAQALKAKEYETIYVLRSDVDADLAEKVQNRVEEVVGRESGKLMKVESWGRRKLAYPVGKQRKGVYVYVKYAGRGGLVTELERNLRLADSVLKFQTVVLREDVDLGELAVDPEEVKLGRLDLPPDDEIFESREKSLGLVDMPVEHRGAPPVEVVEPAAEPTEEAAAAAPAAAAPAAAPAAEPASDDADKPAAN